MNASFLKYVRHCIAPDSINIRTRIPSHPVYYIRTSNRHQHRHKSSTTMDSPPDEVKQQWKDKLVGKKIVDSPSSHPDHFCKQDLPQGTQAHRVIAPGMMVTRDFLPSRMNVHVDDEGTCTHIRFG
ncbi:hypothetical protein TWF481_003387 [Arthrobotrys musiformis]|uniref:Uncharacterized protein n=1 Tax=Arthrobotrys musiformis TaxID=47236 RepID=A0AAV9VRV8_9PEZI